MKILLLYFFTVTITNCFAQDQASDRTYYFISTKVRGIANELDSFFGSKRTDEDFDNGTRIRTFWTFYKIESKDAEAKPGIKVRLRLPNLSNKFRIVIENDNNSSNQQKRGPIANENIHDNQSTSLTAAIRFIKRSGEKWNFNWDTGVKTKIPPVLFSKIRLRRSWEFADNWELRASEEIFQYSDIGFGQSTRLELDRPIRADLLYRLYASANWLNSDDITHTSYGNGLLHQLSHKKGLAYNFAANFINRPMYHVTDYDLSISLRQLIHKTWLFFELRPGLSFPRSRHWRETPYIFFKLELVFGEMT